MKKSGKIVFWIVSPFVFAGLFRLFFLIFYFVYGWGVILVVGRDFHFPIMVLALATSLLFTVCVVAHLYKQYVKHLLGEE